MEDEVDGTGMIDDIEPVANVLTLAINRQRLAMADIIDEQRNQFLRELIGAVIIRAVSHHDRHTIGIVEGTHEVVGRSL